MQRLHQEQEITEADSLAECAPCGTGASAGYSGTEESSSSRTASRTSVRTYSDWTLRSSVDEVAVLFAATDHGKAVGGLSRADVAIRDDGKAPASILGFRNESELPLRLGLVIDTSASITGRFSFEQRATAKFLEKVLAGPNDLAFVVGFSNSVLLTQDFTRDEARLSPSIAQLAPSGGTAAWDAVSLAVEKLGNRREQRPIARIVVVISDGEDNSSSTTLKEVIASAQRQEVIVYTVSANERGIKQESDLGNRSLKLLSERTGGGSFVPASLSQLNRKLEELQQVIRSRYLITYKPAEFARDGQYRTINIDAEKAGHKLRVFARKGYYTAAPEKSN
ncbi:MAG TPA: VWA domain-containing protein [Candidatus Sulfotelmatobacter sp.]